MIYSKSKNFVFIHIYKCAGTSIRDALKPYNDTFNKRLFLDKCLARFGINSSFAPCDHIGASDAKIKYLGAKLWDNAYTFGVVRNPWDWQVSLYSYILQLTTHHEHKLVSAMKSFDEYIAWRCGRYFPSQSDFLVDLKGNLLVKDVYKLESLGSDIQRLASHIGCDVRLKQLNQSRSDSYRQYYSDKSREMVGRFFKEDIQRFGYEF